MKIKRSWFWGGSDFKGDGTNGDKCSHNVIALWKPGSSMQHVQKNDMGFISPICIK